MKNRRLLHSLTLNFVLAALVPIFFLSGIILFHLAHDAKKETEAKSRLIAITVSSQVDIFLHEPLAVVQNISALLKANPSWNDETIRQLLNLHIRESNLFESVHLLDAQGVVENTGLPASREGFQEEFTGISLSHLPFYKHTATSGKVTWSDTFFSVLNGKMSLAFAVPVDKRILIGNLDFHSLSDFIQKLSAGQNIQIMLIDGAGTIIVHPDQRIADTLINVSNLPIVQQGFTGDESMTTFTFNNTHYIGSTKIIPGPEWLVLVSQTVRETYHPLSATALSFLVVALAAIMLAILFALVKARKILTPITEVASHAHEIAGGNYSVTFSNSPYAEIRELTRSILDMADAVRKRENELRMSQMRFREIYNTTSEAIFIRNMQTYRLIDANRAMTNLLGYSLDELKELSIADISAGDPVLTQQRAQTKINKVLREGPQVFEWDYKRKNGESFWAEVTLKQAEIDGHPRVLGVIRDITERKSFERQLAQSQKMEAIGTLAGGIAHDFNNILTPILGYVEIAMLHLSDPDKIKKDLGEVLRAVQRAKELVQQILTFSRKEGLQNSPTNVSIIVKEALKLLRSSIPTTIEIRQNIDPGCGLVLANPTQIHQVLMNLCTNAYHAMRENGGIMSVSLGPVAMPAFDNPALKSLPQGSYLKLEVSDTGHGMDKATVGRILEPYFTTKANNEGTGLGLSVVHGIVKGLGGEVTVESEIGRGSTFHVYLPMLEGTIERSAAKRRESPPGGNECILLVDDEEIVLKVQKEMLTSLGYRVETYRDPEEALQSFTNNPDRYAMVITDMTMPRMTGDILAGKMMKLRADQPIILCTGYSETINRERALAIGIKEFLNKPVDFYTFANAVRKILDVHRPDHAETAK